MESKLLYPRAPPAKKEEVAEAAENVVAYDVTS